MPFFLAESYDRWLANIEPDLRRKSWIGGATPSGGRPFKGDYGFDVTFELCCKRVTRQAKVEYICTPEWEYLDARKQAPYVGWPGQSCP